MNPREELYRRWLRPFTRTIGMWDGHTPRVESDETIRNNPAEDLSDFGTLAKGLARLDADESGALDEGGVNTLLQRCESPHWRNVTAAELIAALAAERGK